MSATLAPARAVSPGRILKRELEARGWTQKDLAAILDRPEQTVSEIVRGRKQVTPETALELAKAMGTSADLWLNLEAKYRLTLSRMEPSDDAIERRSRVYAKAPVRELIRRSWIRDLEDAHELEKEVDKFLSFWNPETQALAARRTRTREVDDAAVRAWLCRVKSIAKKQKAKAFDADRVEQMIDDVLNLAMLTEDVAKVPNVLLDHGVRFVIVPHLTGTRIDGALLVDDSKPIIALSLRYDRIDNFWFTLMHELSHLALRHEGSRVDDLDADPIDHEEIAADRHAQELLVPDEVLNRFVDTAGEYLSKTKVIEFAVGIRRTPGIVVGRLQHVGHLPFTHMRKLLHKVSPHLSEWTST
jgi:HTH-type transcriptional regulator/antitoxin HigA